jgi:hypothetical protein
LDTEEWIVAGFGTVQRAFVFSIATAILTSCATTPVAPNKPEYEITFGIVTRPDHIPMVMDQPTQTIPLHVDGTIPRIAADVKRSRDEPFLLSYVVYRKEPDTGRYVEIERSDMWKIKSLQGRMPEAFIRPDFHDGVKSGQYQFAISIDQKLKQTVSFEIVPR